MEEKLPPFILAELFSNSLIDAGENLKYEITGKALPERKEKYLGNYQKKIIVLVNDKNNTYLCDEDLEFFTGILNACKLNLAHIALINYNNNAIDFTSMKNKMQPEYLMLFGMNALHIQLPFTMPDYQVQQYDNCKIVTAPSFGELNQKTQQARTAKTKLWKSLQKMFGLE